MLFFYLRLNSPTVVVPSCEKRRQLFIIVWNELLYCSYSFWVNQKPCAKTVRMMVWLGCFTYECQSGSCTVTHSSRFFYFFIFNFIYPRSHLTDTICKCNSVFTCGGEHILVFTFKVKHVLFSCMTVIVHWSLF